MQPVDYVILAVVVLVLGLSVVFILHSKKKGKGCIGCPDSKSCASGCGCCGQSRAK